MRQSLIPAVLLLLAATLPAPAVQAANQSGNQTGNQTGNQPQAPAALAGRERDATSCLTEVAKAEKRYELPPGILVAISLVESGRRDPISGIIAPWPFTINARGTGRFFETQDEAVRETGKYLNEGYGYVDVGCMQIDLYHHPEAFRTLTAAFDPETNIDYAARYLRRLYAVHRSWTTAVAAYNAGDPRNGTEYLARVLYYWRDLKTTAERSFTPPKIRGAAGSSLMTRRAHWTSPPASSPTKITVRPWPFTGSRWKPGPMIRRLCWGLRNACSRPAKPTRPVPCWSTL